MGWESRSGGRRYYYRAQKIGGRVVKTYLGGPGVGDHAEQEDAERRARHVAEHQELERMAEELDVSEQPLAALEAVTSAMVVTALEAAGLHQHHRGEWRQRRGKTTQGG